MSPAGEKIMNYPKSPSIILAVLYLIPSTTPMSHSVLHETTETGVPAPKGFTNASFMLPHILYTMMKSALSYSPQGSQAEEYTMDIQGQQAVSATETPTLATTMSSYCSVNPPIFTSTPFAQRKKSLKFCQKLPLHLLLFFSMLFLN